LRNGAADFPCGVLAFSALSRSSGSAGVLPPASQDLQGLVHLLIDAGIQQHGIDVHHHVGRYSFRFEATTLGRVPAENGQPQPVAAPNSKVRGPEHVPAVLFPTIVASRSSAAKLATISAALFVHSFTRITILP